MRATTPNLAQKTMIRVIGFDEDDSRDETREQNNDSKGRESRGTREAMVHTLEPKVQNLIWMDVSRWRLEVADDEFRVAQGAQGTKDHGFDNS